MPAGCRVYVYLNLKEYEWVEKMSLKHHLSQSGLIKAMIDEKILDPAVKSWNPQDVDIVGESKRRTRPAKG